MSTSGICRVRRVGTFGKLRPSRIPESWTVILAGTAALMPASSTKKQPAAAVHLVSGFCNQQPNSHAATERGSHRGVKTLLVRVR